VRAASPQGDPIHEEPGCCGTLVALVIAVAVPAALADSSSSITPANGNDYILPDGSVYQLNDDDTYSWIPDVATGNAMASPGRR
jgi:hypothetical protein